MPGFTHVERSEGEIHLHFSHLHHYVSAYEAVELRVTELKEDLVSALARAKKTRNSQVVDQDGEMFFLAHPNGEFSLCLRWKTYKPKRGDDAQK